VSQARQTIGDLPQHKDGSPSGSPRR
jgi:hypothetical protein